MAKKINQRARVLHWLQTNGALTNREAVTELNILSLPKRIEELRNAGVPIVTVYKTSQSGARYGEYRLVK